MPGVPIAIVMMTYLSALLDRLCGRSVNLQYICISRGFLAFVMPHETSCVLADVRMPGMSGIDLQDHLLSLGHPVLSFHRLPS